MNQCLPVVGSETEKEIEEKSAMLRLEMVGCRLGSVCGKEEKRTSEKNRLKKKSSAGF